MNLEQVAYYISNPAALTLADAPDLKTLSEKHPYAAVFSLLYLTALANGKSVDLDTALQQHAFRLNDRAQLYQLINSSGQTVSEAIIPESVEPIETQEEIVTAIEPEKTTPETPTVENEELLEEPVSEAEKEQETRVELAVSSNFDTLTEAFTLEQHFDISDTETPIIELPEEETVEEVVSEPTEIETEEEPEVVPEIIPQVVHETGEKRSFTSWLHTSGQKTAVDVPKTPEKRKFDEIIEHFIKEEPTISRGKTEFFSPPKKAKESLDEETIPVSETLAKIYAAQGNYPKAIHVYHQLMLAFPEKKLLFAVRIEELKKKITS
ncbi:MAG: hypothetical protein HYZ43_06300 [Flavobacteriia bacterium]|nr:hypothetical protein [Flavobacteriia bacterium]